LLTVESGLALIKVVAVYTSPLAIFSGLLLFLPESILEYFGLISIRTEYRPIIASIFLLTVSFLLTHLLSIIWRAIKNKLLVRQHTQLTYSYLKKLTPEEKLVLRKYIEEETESQFLPIQHGITQGLVKKGILYRASQVGTLFGAGFAYNIQPFVKDYLKIHPELLQ
jgi:hypothetical protein